MYAVATFPAVKLCESKTGFIEETENAIKLRGKIGGVILAFNAFGSIKNVIKSYSLKPGDYLAVTAECKAFKEKATGKDNESYTILSAVPVSGSIKAVWPTIYFPALKVLSMKEKEASTGNYFHLLTQDMETFGGNATKRNMAAWSGGTYELAKTMKLKVGSEISAVAQARYTIGPEGKKIDYTLLSFGYLTRKSERKTEEPIPTESEVIETDSEAAFDDVIDVTAVEEEITERKPVNVEFNMNDFEAMFN